MPLPRSLTASVLLLVGCGSNRALDGVRCEDHPTELAFDEASPLGFTPAELVAGIPASESPVLTWADGGTTLLTLGWTAGTTARYVESVEVYPDDGGEHTLMAPVCDDRVEVDGTLTFATDDGAFAEVWTVVVAGASPDPRLTVPLALDDLAGDFDLEPFVDAEDWDELSASVAITWADGASAGVVSGQASGEEDGCVTGETCSAWAEEVDVATWGAPAE